MYLLPNSFITHWVSSLLYSLESLCSIRQRSCSTLEYSPTSCLAPWNHCEEKHEKTITRIINKKSPFRFSFDACRHGVEFWKAGEIYFFHLGKWKIVSVEERRMSAFEGTIILSHLPGTLKVFWWLTYPFLFNNTTLFISRGGTQLARFAKQRYTWSLASKLLASLSR